MADDWAPVQQADDWAPVATGPTTQQRAVISANDNAEEAAKAVKLSKQIGVPPTVVQSDVPAYDAHQRTESAKRASANPAIARYIDGNPMAAKVSGDDWDGLDEASQTLRALHPELFAKQVQGGVLRGIPEVAELAGTPQGREKLFAALKELPKALGEGILDFFNTPGKVYSGEIDLNSPAGLDQGISFGIGAALGSGRVSAGPATGLEGIPGTRQNKFLAGNEQAIGREITKPQSFDDFMATLRGMKTRAEIDDFLASKQPGPPGAMLQITKAESGAEALSKAVEVAQESKTKTRSPEMFEEFANAHDAGSVHIDAAKVLELYQKEGKTPAPGDGLFGWVPSLSEKLNTAVATGGELTVPTGSYIAHVDPTVHEGLRDSVRLHDDGVTLEEAKEIKETKPIVSLEKEDVGGSLTSYKINNAEGKQLARADIELSKYEGVGDLRGPTEARIVDIYAPSFEPTPSTPEEMAVALEAARNALGPREMRAALQEFRKLHPTVKTLTGKRISGARFGGEFAPGSTGENISMQLPELSDNPTVAATQESATIQKDALYLNGLFKDAKSVGLTEPEFKRYSDLLERADAYVLERAVKLNRSQIAQSVTAEWKRNETAVKDEVTQELTDTGRFAVAKFQRDNNITIDPSNADELAPLFGYDSGQELLAGVDAVNMAGANGKSWRTQLADAIKTETAARMEERYGRLAENIATEAREIALTEHSFDIMAEEVRILANLANATPPLSRQEMVNWAKGRFENSTVADAANYDKHQRAVVKAGREAEKALLKGDYAEAFVAKQRQMLAATVAKESLRLQTLIDRTEAKIDRFTNEQTIKSIDQGMLEQIREMLASVGVPQIHAPSTEPMALRDAVTAAEGQLAVAPWLFENAPQIKDMTVEQFRAFTDSLKSMEHVGRDMTKLENAMGQAELQNVIFDIVKELARFNPIDQPTLNPSMGQRIRSVGRKIVGMHLLVERALDYTDKFNPHGPLTEWLDRPLRDANVKEIQLTEQIVRDMKALKEYVTPEILQEIPNKLIPDALDKTGFMKMTRQNLRVLMLNMGNWSNMQKLSQGFGVNEADLRRFVDQHATKSDVAWVNGIWKIFEKLKPEADAVQTKDTGVPVDSIPAVPWEIKGGKLNGGYYPLSYDMYNSDIQGHIAKPLFDRGYFSAATPHGYTKERTGYTGAIDLSGDFLASKLRGMAHDIAFRLPVRNANKLIENQEFRTAMARAWGTEVSDLLPGWLRDIANSHNFDDAYAKDFTRASALLRQNVVSALIAYNPGTFIKHGFTAAVMSSERVGGGNLLSATWELGLKGAFKNLKELASKTDRIPDEDFMESFRDLIDQGQRGENARQFILDSSAVMRNRQRQYDESIRGAADQITNVGIGQDLANFRQRQMLYGRMAVAFSDQMSAMPMWLAAYKKAYQSGESHADSVFIADKEVSRAHGSNFIGDKPAIMRQPNTLAGEGMRWFTPLMQFWNHQQNNQFQLAWDVNATLKGNPAGEPGANAARISKAVAAIMAIILIEEMAGPAKDEHGHGLAVQLALATVRFFGGGYFMLRDVTNGLAHGYEPSTGMLSTLYKAGTETAKDLAKATGTKAGQTKDWIRNTMTAIGFATGVGGSQPGRTGQFIYDVAMGKDRPQTFNDYRQGFRTGHSKARKFK